MTEIIEGFTEDNPLEGEIIIAHEGQKIFKNINAVADFVNVFGIKHYVIRDGHTTDGKYVVQLQYTKQNI